MAQNDDEGPKRMVVSVVVIRQMAEVAGQHNLQLRSTQWGDWCNRYWPKSCPRDPLDENYVTSEYSLVELYTDIGGQVLRA